MAREWHGLCIDCGKPFGYSDTTHQDLIVRGASLPRLCGGCERAYLRERRALARTDAAVAPGGDASQWQIGQLRDMPPPHYHCEDRASIVDDVRGEFGVKDDQLLEYYRHLDDPHTQVILVEAPTGAGKSTFFPYRLLAPPEGVADPRLLTRGGQIVVTQPRVQATRNLPGFVSKLHGCSVGAGYDIGFRHSKEHASDWRSRLVYVTDGTLINWIAAGQLSSISLIMLDEAHERSLNIDLILGLLTQTLPRYPQLKLVIASATIDRDHFLNHFRRRLTGGATCALTVFDGKQGKPVKKHFRCGLVRSEDEKKQPVLWPRDQPKPSLPYDKSDVATLLPQLEDEVAKQCVEILHEMFPPAGKAGSLVCQRGDILGFLQGVKPINNAVAQIRKEVAKSPNLRGIVEVLPLYTNLPQADQDKALGNPWVVHRQIDGQRAPCQTMVLRLRPDWGSVAAGEPLLLPTGPDAALYSNDARTGVPGRRVVISTNVAETSLTIHGIRHVVETGIINQGTWDTERETKRVVQSLHSQAGCTQRWGRAGRVAPGDAWCLYTAEQFAGFDRDTEPQIRRSQLEPVILTAKIAGIDSLDPADFPWLDAPSPRELERATGRLKQYHALDEDGDITALGIEIAKFGADPQLAKLMIMADKFACAVEMATLLAFMETRKPLLLKSDHWDEATRELVGRTHRALTQACADDLEGHLKIFSAWLEARNGGPTVTASAIWSDVWARHRPALSDALRESLGGEESANLLEAARQVRTRQEAEALTASLTGRVTPLRNWADEVERAFVRATSETWARLWMVDDAVLQQVERRRDELVASLAVRKKENERRPIHFELLERVRALFVWCCPEQCYVKVEGGRQYVAPRHAGWLEELNRLIEEAHGKEEQWSEEEEEQVTAAVEERAAIERFYVNIEERSFCAEKTPECVIALGSVQRFASVQPKAPPVAAVQASFVVRTTAARAKACASASEMQLALLLREAVAPPASREAGPVRRRLFIDQAVPPFTQFEYSPLERLNTRFWSVALGRPVAYWPASAIAEYDSAASTEDDDNGSGSELSTTIQVDPGLEVHEDPHERPRTEDAEDSDDEPADGEDERARRPVSDLDIAAPGGLPVWLGSRLPNPDDPLPVPHIGEVMGYEQGGLLLETPTPQYRYEVFRRQFELGQDVPVRVVEKIPAIGPRSASLRVIELSSGLESIVPVAELAFHGATALLQSYGAGDELSLRLVRLEPRRRHAGLSALPAIAEAQLRLAQSSEWRRPVTARICATRSQGVDLAVDSPYGSFTAELYFGANTERTLAPTDAGEEMNVTLQYRASCFVDLPEPPEDWAALLPRLRELTQGQLDWVEARGQLQFQLRVEGPQGVEFRPMTWQQAEAVRQLTTEARVHAAIDRLHRFSNSLRAQVADPFLGSRYMAGLEVRGRWWGGRLVLDSGIRAQLDMGEAETYRPVDGSLMFARVMQADGRRQSVQVSLREEGFPPASVDRLMRAECRRLGYVAPNEASTFRNLPPEQQKRTPVELREMQRRLPFVCWTRMRIPRDENNRPTAGYVLGRDALPAIREESGALVFGDRDELFAVAIDGGGVDRAMDALTSRLKHWGEMETRERVDGPGPRVVLTEEWWLEQMAPAGVEAYPADVLAAERPRALDRLKGALRRWLS